jgi:HPt (histidine-containing phosphotransfer) domain-containing protein
LVVFKSSLSTANLIGAKKLGHAAQAVEKALKENNAPPAQDIWNALEGEFEAAMAELDRIAPAAPGMNNAAGDLDKTRALALIRKLEPLIKSGSGGALSLRDDIREILSPAGEECGKLIARIENLDFSEAMETLNQIREKAELCSNANPEPAMRGV